VRILHYLDRIEIRGFEANFVATNEKYNHTVLIGKETIGKIAKEEERKPTPNSLLLIQTRKLRPNTIWTGYVYGCQQTGGRLSFRAVNNYSFRSDAEKVNTEYHSKWLSLLFTGSILDSSQGSEPPKNKDRRWFTPDVEIRVIEKLSLDQALTHPVPFVRKRAVKHLRVCEKNPQGNQNAAQELPPIFFLESDQKGPPSV